MKTSKLICKERLPGAIGGKPSYACLKAVQTAGAERNNHNYRIV